MFNTISWHSYCTTLAICLAIYYSILFILYYRNDLLLLLESKRGSSTSLANDEEFIAPPKDSEEGIVYACVDELNAFFEEARKRKWEKKELVYALQSVVKKYPSIEQSGFKQSVSAVVKNQCEHICRIHLNEEELGHVWLG